MSACLVPARGVGFALGSPPGAVPGSLLAGAVSVAFLPLPLDRLLFAGVAAPSASLAGAGASVALAVWAAGGAV